jgi:aminopeptidase N
MRTDQTAPVRLSDYQPYPFRLDSVDLEFQLDLVATRVKARLAFTRTGESGAALRLDGERLKLLSIAIDGAPLSSNAYQLDDESLTIADAPDQFVLETEVEINPSANTSLDGLYVSGGRFCTQCEAEGFRKITFFPDRPDVLAPYSVRIEADKAAFPRLLSNGNLVQAGDAGAGRHYALWRDPFNKPCYLFALVAGELDELADSFITMSGRNVELRIYVDPGQAPRAAYAMDALKRSMRWDEARFGREYDLDLFMIVAVRDFNFGAMENKGLNIFNASLLLADEATATDADYERIESVVAHEYFHNWTGNRITCRDWFQLCLKEGLTVFRDQSFSADMRGEAVQRIKDVKMLRARQFAEDAGPMAHPVRPSSYLKIDNFYTATIYEKGAELIRMLKLVVGEAAFRAGMDLYFERYDGTASTVEAFVACFADASGQDLDPFFRWYEQAGTPELAVDVAHDAERGVASITLAQRSAPTPGQPEKAPVPIPVALGLLDISGQPLMDTCLVMLDGAERTIELPAPTRPVISALRGFSAPVTLKLSEPAPDAYVRLAHDPDAFNRWEAAQGLARGLILARAGGSPSELDEERFAEALGAALADAATEAAFKALLLGLPSESDLALGGETVDPQAIHAARDMLRLRIAVHLGDQLRAVHGAMQSAEPFSPDAASAGRRALRNAALEMLAADPHAENLTRAERHYASAGCMTEEMGGLNALLLIGGQSFERALTDFYSRWKAEPLVIDKWFALQARAPGEDALGRVLGLSVHPDFDPKNPNRLRALVQTFASGNPARFHDPSGAGYRFLGDHILAADRINPSVAARLVEPLASWRRYRPDLATKMRAELSRILDGEDLSKNLYEQASRAFEADPKA